MTNYSGYMGKVALLDLSEGEVRDYPWSDEDRRQYIGGKAMAEKLLADVLKGKTDALSSESPIVIATGPLTGTGAPCSNHFFVAALSPLSGGISVSGCGGDFGLYLKKAGFDALVIKGKCENPTWIVMKNDKLSFNDCGDMWGMELSAAQEEMKKRLDEQRNCNVKCGMLCIGPAGENLVPFASVASGERDVIHCDLGAVFGSKNLKGIVATGNNDVPVADRPSAVKSRVDWIAALRRHPLTGDILPVMGTAGFVPKLQSAGLLPVKNYSAGTSDRASEIGGESFAKDHNIGCTGCTYCPIKCERLMRNDLGTLMGPGLEAMVLLGSNIQNYDVNLIIKWSRKLHELGLDLRTAANVLAQAMDEGRHGVAFGKSEGVCELFSEIASGEAVELAKAAVETPRLDLEALAVGSYIGEASATAQLWAELNEAVASCGQCEKLLYSEIPAWLVKKDGTAAAFIARKLMPVAVALLRIAGKLPESVGLSLPMSAFATEMKHSVGMELSLDDFLTAGKNGIEAAKTLGGEDTKVVLPKGLTSLSKALPFAIKLPTLDEIKSGALRLPDITGLFARKA